MTLKLLDILTSPWAIMPDKLVEIQSIYATHLRGEKISQTALSEIEAKLGKPLNNDQKPYQVENGVAIIEIDGIIAKRMNLFTKISGGVSTQLIKSDFLSAMRDTDVKAILLNVDSPGGTVDGTEELAETIYNARLSGDKPIVAYTDGLMASAAYWIASSADKIYISGDTPWIGSIGVVTSHVDYSKYEEKLGIKTTEIYAGKYKRIDSEYNPLSKEGERYLKDQVNYIYTLFVNKVADAKNLSTQEYIDTRDGSVPFNEDILLLKEFARYKTIDQIRAEEEFHIYIPWADGKIFIGKQAIEAGLVDGVSTRDRLIERLSKEGKLMMVRAAIEQETERRLQKNGINS
jgi:signal peptide peptidase SppA